MIFFIKIIKNIMPNVVLVEPGQSPNNQAKRQAEAAAALAAMSKKRKSRKGKNRKNSRKSRK